MNILEGSAPSFRSELDLFRLSLSDVSIVNTEFQPNYPVYSVKEITNPLEFFILGDNSHYISLKESFLYIRAHIKQQDDSQIPDADKVALGNLFFSTMFQNLHISLNNQTVFDSGQFYPYHAYIQNLLGYGEAIKTTELTKQIYYQNDQPTSFDPNANKSFKIRMDMAKASKSFDMIGNLYCGLFEQSKYLIPAVDLRITFQRSRPEFCLDYEDTTKKYIVKIDEAVFYAKRHNINPQIYIAHQQLLSSGQTCKYPHKTTLVKSFSLAAGALSSLGETIFAGPIPQLIVIGMIESLAFSGAPSKVPFNFQHFNLTDITLKIDSENSTQQSIHFDFANNRYLLGYNTLSQALQEPTAGNYLSRTDYTNGNVLCVFDLGTKAGFLNPQRHGTIKLELNLSSTLSTPVNVLVYGQFQSLIQIDGFRRVTTSYE